ncbi:MAG: hypothetical protein MUF34_31210 [Polyangiaceae bacterium]|nr:hypothetical protein [Polyangiaceae bacterium]
MQKLRLSTKGQEFQIFAIEQLIGVVYPSEWGAPIWREFLHVAKSALPSLAHCRAVLVFVPGRTLTATERKTLVEVLPPPPTHEPMRQAVLSNNLLIRGTLIATGWLMQKPNYELRPFPTSGCSNALEWLNGVARFDSIEAMVELKQAVIASRQDVRLLRVSA